MSIPEAIRNQRPTQFGACEIRLLNNHYYVYQITSEYSRVTKRSRKKTGKCIGKISEQDGFIPNRYAIELMQQNGMLPPATGAVTYRSKTFGAYELLSQLSPNLETDLKKCFPDCYREIRTIALLRLVEGVASTRVLQSVFEQSYLSDLAPDLSISEGTVQRFILRLGTMQERAESFMRLHVTENTTLLFDGTSIFLDFGDSLAASGYNAEHSRDPQARLLYVFEKDTHCPLFYVVIQGSIVDKSEFLDVVQRSGCKDVIILGDKGFYSKKNVSALMESHLKYILPLQENTKAVKQEFFEREGLDKFDGTFAYHGRAIWYHKQKSGNLGDYIYIFMDEQRRAQEHAHFIERCEDDYDESANTPMDLAKMPRMGYFCFCSNLDAAPKEIYLDYKERWDIEECFDYLKNSVRAEASHAHNDEYFRGLAFLNHISLLYYYGHKFLQQCTVPNNCRFWPVLRLLRVFAVTLQLAVVLDLLCCFYRIRVNLHNGYSMRGAPGSEAKPVMARRLQRQNNLRLIVLCRDSDHPVIGSLKAFLVVFEGKWLVCESSPLSIDSPDKVLDASDITADDHRICRDQIEFFVMSEFVSDFEIFPGVRLQSFDDLFTFLDELRLFFFSTSPL